MGFRCSNKNSHSTKLNEKLPERNSGFDRNWTKSCKIPYTICFTRAFLLLETIAYLANMFQVTLTQKECRHGFDSD